MKIKIFAFLNLLVGSISFGYSQNLSPSVLASAGGSNKTNEISLDWTLGESAIETYSSANGLITEGFHQPILILTQKLPNVPLLVSGYTIKVFPNPVSSTLNININSVSDRKVHIKLTDNNGRTVYSTSTYSKGSTVRIDLRNFASGLYEIIIQDFSGLTISTYKIIKAA